MKIEAGKFYRTRDGQKVGPMNVPPKGRWLPRVVADAEVGDDQCAWWDGGRYDRDSEDPLDLIAEWTDPVDLTAITTPFGLLDAETQAALKAHGGPYEAFGLSCDGWHEWSVRWDNGCFAYRVKPAPPKPREWWAVGRSMKDSYADAEAFRAECDRISPDMKMLDLPIIHVREVLPE